MIELLINNQNAREIYGITILQQSYMNLVDLPESKKVETISWPDEDGEEVDLSRITLASKELTLPLFFSRRQGYAHFIDLLKSTPYHTFSFRDLKREFRLRYVREEGRIEHLQGMQVKFRFTNDTPISDSYTYQAPQSSYSAQPSGYLLDDTDLSRYGVQILRGSSRSLESTPEVKQNLKIENAALNGTRYLGASVWLKGKSATLSCLLRARSIDEFWRCYDALLFDLTRPRPRILTVVEHQKSYPCYYKGGSVVEFHADKPAWLIFKLNLALI